MTHDICTVEHGLDGIEVAQITVDMASPWMQVGRRARVSRGQQRIDGDDVMAAFDELIHDVRADEPGASRDHDP